MIVGRPTNPFELLAGNPPRENRRKWSRDLAMLLFGTPTLPVNSLQGLLLLRESVDYNDHRVEDLRTIESTAKPLIDKSIEAMAAYDDVLQSLLHFRAWEHQQFPAMWATLKHQAEQYAASDLEECRALSLTHIQHTDEIMQMMSEHKEHLAQAAASAMEGIRALGLDPVDFTDVVVDTEPENDLNKMLTLEHCRKVDRMFEMLYRVAEVAELG